MSENKKDVLKFAIVAALFILAGSVESILTGWGW